MRNSERTAWHAGSKPESWNRERRASNAMDEDRKDNSSGVPAWVLAVGAVVALFFWQRGTPQPPTPPGPGPGPQPPIVVAEPAGEYFRSYARLMEATWEEAATKAESGQFDSAAAANEWMKDR